MWNTVAVHRQPLTAENAREVVLEDLIEEMLPPDVDPRLVQAASRQCKDECLLSDDCDCSQLELWQITIIGYITVRAKHIAQKFNGR